MLRRDAKTILKTALSLDIVAKAQAEAIWATFIEARRARPELRVEDIALNMGIGQLEDWHRVNHALIKTEQLRFEQGEERLFDSAVSHEELDLDALQLHLPPEAMQPGPPLPTKKPGRLLSGSRKGKHAPRFGAGRRRKRRRVQDASPVAIVVGAIVIVALAAGIFIFTRPAPTATETAAGAATQPDEETKKTTASSTGEEAPPARSDSASDPRRDIDQEPPPTGDPTFTEQSDPPPPPDPTPMTSADPIPGSTTAAEEAEARDREEEPENLFRRLDEEGPLVDRPEWVESGPETLAGLVERGEFEEALGLLDQMVDWYAGHGYPTEAHSLVQQRHQVEAAWAESIQGEVRNDVRAASVHFRECEFDEALPYLTRWVELGQPDALSLLGAIRFFYGEYDQARQLFQRIEEKGPVEQRFLAVLDNPFTAEFGQNADRLEGLSPKGHYYLLTDLGVTPEAAARVPEGKAHPYHRQLASLLDMVYEAYSAVFPLPRNPKMVSQVFIFRDRGAFEAWSLRVTGDRMENAAAYYSPVSRTLVVAASKTLTPATELDAYTQDSIFHEAFHQFIDFYVRNCPPWFNEGVAEYFGPSQVIRGQKKLRVGIVPSTAAQELNRLSIMREYLRAGRYTPLRQLLRMDQEAFYADGNLHYAQAWSFVHFLAHGLPKGKELLIRYFKILNEGGTERQAFEECFGGVDFAKLEEKWKGYVLGL